MLRALVRAFDDGAVSALVMNVCLAVLPLAGANLALTWESETVHGYPPTESARRATRAEVERAAQRLMPTDMDRRRGWESLVLRELEEGDPHAARGFVLAAPTLLPPGDASQIDRRLTALSTDAEIAAAAAPFLSNETRGAFDSAAAWMARNDAQFREDPANYLVLGEARDLALQANAWLAGRDPDHLALALVAISAALDREIDPRVALGAAALKDARRAGRLGPRLAAQLEARAEAALPPVRLRDAFTAVAAAPETMADEAGAFTRAARAALDPAGFAMFAAPLAEIGDMAAATSARGAMRLLAQGRDLRDLPRLRLIAQAGGDRAIAVAKRLREGAPLASAARGTITWTPALMIDLVAVCGTLFGIIAAASAMFAVALARDWGRRP